MFTALSDCILAHNGVIYGVTFDNAFTVRHDRAENVEFHDQLQDKKTFLILFHTDCGYWTNIQYWQL